MLPAPPGKLLNQVGLDLSESRDDVTVADGKAYPPSGHIIRLRKRMKFNTHFLCSVYLHEAQRLFIVEIYLAVRGVVAYDNVVFFRKPDHFFIE
jgi:hypothetical protein